MLLESENVLGELLECEKTVLPLENLGTLVAVSGFGEIFEHVSRLRDIAISSVSYLIIHAEKGALDERAWELLKSELTFIE